MILPPNRGLGLWGEWFSGVMVDQGGTNMFGRQSQPRLPPPSVERAFWFAHRRLYRLTGGRIGLWRAKGDRWGAMCVHAIGRRTGADRDVIVGYFEDGPDLITMAMNGWQPADPAWWLDVQAHPDVEVDLRGEHRLVSARAAVGEERERLWARWQEIDKNLDTYAARRPNPTPVVVFEPRGETKSLG
jgi:F420H(2)-dependent quinone reductase